MSDCPADATIIEQLNGNVVVRRAYITEIETIAAILDDAACWLQSRGINQWHYPFPRTEIEQRFTNGAIYVAFSADQPVGTFALLPSDPAIWGDATDDALYLHGLAIRRTGAGHGLGYVLLRHAESIAATQGNRLLRLDCWAGNDTLRHFYERAGFRECGVTEEKIGSNVWHCRRFEKPIA